MANHIYLAGNSTVQTYGDSTNQGGWGQFLGSHLPEHIQVINRAIGGRSSKTFVEEGRLQAILDVIEPDDWLFVQMGHNDASKNKPERYTEPYTTYKQYLKQYIAGAREKGAHPLVITPVARFHYENDIDIMREVGVNVVRIGEFAWSVMEPEEGKIDVGFFKEIIARLYESGIETIMCTPTLTPPIWFSHGRPERMHVNEKREIMGHGSRQHACTNNPYFRKKTAIITTAIAKELGRLPGLIGWQLDNEFKCHVAECMCETCLRLWHDWLKNRYGVIERLNEAWGTDVWSETYQTFEQVPQPGPYPVSASRFPKHHVSAVFDGDDRFVCG
nr:beta-galactosidase [Bacillus subtilis]